MKVIKALIFAEINSGVVISTSNLISFYKNKKLHKKDSCARIYEYRFVDWYYKGAYFGGDDDFTNKTWKKKVKQLKREEKLKIFI